MVNINKLKGKMVEKNYNVELLADRIGMDKSTLYRRLNSDGGDFSIKEVFKIVEILSIDRTEATSIFFDNLIA